VTRLVALHGMTVTATVVLLVVLALPARWVLERPASGRTVAGLDVPFAPVAAPRRVFGVYVDPWHVDEWGAAVGAAPQAVAKFAAFGSPQHLRAYTREAERKGLRRILISWEPWTPVPSRLGTAAQARPQPGMRNIDIARGAQDRYIARFAHRLARFHGTVYLRYAHEMNGYWYPWSRDARAYRWAWRRMVHWFHVAGARNVRFVWSVNPNLYQSVGAWRANLRRYWPGRRYVDYVASTMINFGGEKTYPVRRFARRLRVLHRDYGAPVLLAETNTEVLDALGWLYHLREMLGGMPWVRGVFWSQLPSRGQQQQPGAGVLDWDVTANAAASEQLRGIIRDGERPSG
jgi:mannan endo-1,4-beta-mannosidase